MANGSSSDSDEFLFRSNIHTGLKREFAFALKSQAQLSPSPGSTRSGKLFPNPNPQSKKLKNSPPRFDDGDVKIRDLEVRVSVEELVVENPVRMGVNNATSAQQKFERLDLHVGIERLDLDVGKEDNGVMENAGGFVIDVVVVEDLVEVGENESELDQNTVLELKMTQEDLVASAIENAGSLEETPVIIIDSEGTKMEDDRGHKRNF